MALADRHAGHPEDATDVTSQPPSPACEAATSRTASLCQNLATGISARSRNAWPTDAVATFAITGAFRGIQNLNWGMWISLLGAVVNFVLNPILIFGSFGVEGMGIAGSAWASLIAQVAMFMLAVVIMVQRTPFPLIPRSWHHPELLGLWLLSGNLFARTIALNACYYLGNRFATGYGEAYIAAHSIVMQVWLFSAFFIDGYAAGGSSLVGRFAGAKDHEKVDRTVYQGFLTAAFISLGVLAPIVYELCEDLLVSSHKTWDVSSRIEARGWPHRCWRKLTNRRLN